MYCRYLWNSIIFVARPNLRHLSHYLSAVKHMWSSVVILEFLKWCDQVFLNNQDSVIDDSDEKKCVFKT